MVDGAAKMSSRAVVGQGVATVSGVRMASPRRNTAPDSFSVGEKTTTTWSTLFLYGFVVLLLVMMAVMLATTPVPEWMDGSGDEGPTIGGPSTHRQEKRMPWTFDNGYTYCMCPHLNLSVCLILCV